MNENGAGYLDGDRRVVVHAPTLRAETDAAREIGAVVLGAVLEQARMLGEVPGDGTTPREGTVSRPTAPTYGPGEPR